jgi:hypothetical protein
MGWRWRGLGGEVLARLNPQDENKRYALRLSAVLHGGSCATGCPIDVVLDYRYGAETAMSDEHKSHGETPAEPDRKIPSDIASRYAVWERQFKQAIHGNTVLGICSVASSSIAVVVGSFDARAGQIFAGVAAVLTATIGFLRPERTYLKFVKAWRVLDVAIMQYRACLIDRAQLIEAARCSWIGVPHCGLIRDRSTGPPGRSRHHRCRLASRFC